LKDPTGFSNKGIDTAHTKHPKTSLELFFDDTIKLSNRRYLAKYLLFKIKDKPIKQNAILVAFWGENEKYV